MVIALAQLPFLIAVFVSKPGIFFCTGQISSAGNVVLSPICCRSAVSLLRNNGHTAVNIPVPVCL